MAQTVRRNGGAFVVLIPPSNDHSTGSRELRDAYRSALRQLDAAGLTQTIDAGEAGTLNLTSFVDNEHLDATGAREFSLWLGRKLLTLGLLDSKTATRASPLIFE